MVQNTVYSQACWLTFKIPATWEAEAGGFWVWASLEQGSSKTLYQKQKDLA
jgi:hypothetical protein